MEKRCSKCKVPRPIEEFHWQGKGRRAKCKHCVSEEFKGRYKNDPRRRKQVIEAVARRRRKLFQFVRELKDNKPCLDCGVPYPYYVMDFDHREDKSINISEIVNKKGWSKKRILEEVEKCDLICSNCHRIRTFVRLEGGV